LTSERGKMTTSIKKLLESYCKKCDITLLDCAYSEENECLDRYLKIAQIRTLEGIRSKLYDIKNVLENIS
jgi:hypothetical protein